LRRLGPLLFSATGQRKCLAVVTCSLLPDIHSVVAGLVNFKRTPTTLHCVDICPRSAEESLSQGWDWRSISPMPDWIAKLLQEWPLVAAAPIPFAIAFVSIAAAISLAVGWSYRKRADRRLLDHGDRPGGATAKEENTDALERMVALTIGSRWTPLNETEIAALSTRL